jgi:translocation and assembly module TamB
VRRAFKILAWVASVVIALPLVLVGFLYVAANMDWGRRLVETGAGHALGGGVVVSGLSGHFPDDLRLAHAEVRDAEGPWLIADDLALAWSPSRLSRKALKIESLRAGRVQVLRLPPQSEKESERGELQGRIDVDRLEVTRLEVGTPIAGAAAALRVEGAAHVASLTDGEAAFDVTRIDGPGTYNLKAKVDASAVKAEIALDEPAHGLVSGLARLPELGALSLHLAIDGPRNAEAARLEVTAGPLRASGQGLVDLVGRTIDVDLSASAPAMAPRPDLAWKSASLKAHVHGPFTGPDATGQLRIDELKAGDASARSVRADVQGNRGAVAMRAVLERMRVPGPRPALFESAPVQLQADVRLDDAARPVTFAISHPLLSVQGQANTGGDWSGRGTVAVPSLAPFAAIAGVDLKGHTNFEAIVTTRDRRTEVTLEGMVGVTGGAAPAPDLLGNAARVVLAASIHDESITVKRADIDGKTIHLSAKGTATRDKVDFDWKLGLSDLAALSADVSGRMEAQGRVQGPRTNLELVADATGDVGTKQFPHGPIKSSVRLKGLPASPSGRIEASGTLDGAPLQVALAFDRGRDGALRSTIERADWKSAHAEGELTLHAGERLPRGRMAIRVAKLDDLQPWIGQPVQGGVTAEVDLVQTGGRAQAKIRLDARNAGVPGTQVEHLAVTGTVDDPAAHASVALQVAADGISSNSVTGQIRLDVDGPQEALKLKLSSSLHHETEGDVPLNATATLDANAKRLSIATLQAQYRGQPVLLLAPVRLSYGDGVAVDRLRVGMQQAVLEVSGRVSPTLDVTASLRNVTPAVAKTFDVDLQADGTLTADARLQGTIAEPRGTMKLAANGLRRRTGSAARLPPASVVASAELTGQSARVDAKISAGGQSRLEASGRVPLSASGPIEVHTTGTIDAAIANSILEVNGRRVKGRIAVDLAVRGTLGEPRIEGGVKVADGELQDYALGVQLTKIEAQIEATGEAFRIVAFNAHAGSGTVAATGTVGMFATGRPIDLKFTARNATPLSTDLLTANLDADIRLYGPSQTRLDATGSIDVHRAEIKIPKALPPEVAVLDVRRPGQKPPLPSGAGPVIGLDLKVDAPRAVFVRGRGLDAETGGGLHVTGTSAAPQIAGGFDMRRGTFDLGGASLRFTSGKVSFNGTGLSQKIDPTLDFVAESTSNNITAKLTVTGYADAPRIALTSTPDLPQDEILARLLFGTSAKDLTPLQLAQIASAIAAISGVGGDGLNPLAAVQKSLGLDRLSTGSTPTGGTTVEAGRYVSERVYVGAKQNTQGGTQAQVQVDLTKNLKLQATLGMGGTVPVQGTTPDNDPGSSVGFSYQFEY